MIPLLRSRLYPAPPPIVEPPPELVEPAPENPEEVDPDPFPIPSGASLDLDKLKSDADARYDKMSKNPKHRGDVDQTFAAFVRGVVAGKDQAVADAISAQADVVLQAYEARGVGRSLRAIPCLQGC